MRAMWIVGLLASFGGCGPIGTIVSRNIRGLGEAPRPVLHRLDDPRRDDVPLAVTWIGHATLLIQLHDRFVLTDPVFADTVGQFSPRLVEPGLTVESLPELDFVLVSHNHIDHLNYPSLDALAPKTKALAVPRGSLVYIPPLSRVPVREVRRWHFLEREGLRVTAVPVRHSGYRYGLDDAWIEGGFTGWMIEYRGLTVYFGGDTAYDRRSFVETKRRFAPIDLALLPIAPVEPREMARKNHVDGREAVQAFLDLGAQHMVPMHYDTFPHAADRLGDAEKHLRRAMAEADLDAGRVHILPVGGQWPVRRE